MSRRLVVFGPNAQAVVVVALLAAAVAFAVIGLRLEAGLLVTAIVSRMLPVARGRPGDTVKVITRGAPANCWQCGAHPRRGDSPPPAMQPAPPTEEPPPAWKSQVP